MKIIFFNDDFPRNEKTRRRQADGQGMGAFFRDDLTYTSRRGFARPQNACRRPAGKWGKGARE